MNSELAPEKEVDPDVILDSYAVSEHDASCFEPVSDEVEMFPRPSMVYGKFIHTRNYMVIPLEEKLIEDAVEFVEEHYMKYEIFCRTVHLDRHQESMDYFKDVIRHWIRNKVSLVAVEEENNRIVGVIISKLHRLTPLDEEVKIQQSRILMHEPRVQKMQKYRIIVRNEVVKFLSKDEPTFTYIEIKLFCADHQESDYTGIEKMLVKTMHCLADDLGVNSVVAVATLNQEQYILKSLGYIIHCVYEYSRILENNIKIIPITDREQCMVGYYKNLYEEDTQWPTYEDCPIENESSERSKDEGECSESSGSDNNNDNNVPSDNSEGGTLETYLTDFTHFSLENKCDVGKSMEGNDNNLYEEDTQSTYEDCPIENEYSNTRLLPNEEPCSTSYTYFHIPLEIFQGTFETKLTWVSIPDPNSEIEHFRASTYQIPVEQVYSDRSNDEEECSTSYDYDNDIPSNNSEVMSMETNLTNFTNISIPDPNSEIVHWMNGNYQIIYEEDTEEPTHDDCFIDQVYAESSNDEENCSSSKNYDNDIPSNNSDGALLETNVTNISIPDPNLEIVHWMDGNYQIVYEEDTEERTHEDCFIDQVYADSSNDEEKCSSSKNNDNDIPSNNSDGALLETNVTNISIPDPNLEIVHWMDGNYQIIYEEDTEEQTHEDCFIDQVYADSSNDEEKCSSSKNNDNDIPSNNSDGALLETNVTNISIPDPNLEIVHWMDGNYQIIYEEDTEEPTHEDCFIDQVYADSSNDEEKCSSSKNNDNDIPSNNSDGALLETNVTNISIPDPNLEIVHWMDGNYQIVYEEDTEERTHEDCFIDQVYADSSNDEEKCSSSKNNDNDIPSNNSDGALLETNVTNISIPDPNLEIVHWMDGNYQIIYEEDTEEPTHEDCFIDQVYADSSNDEEKCSSSKNNDNDIPSNNSDGALLETNVTNISIPDPNLEIVHWMDGNFQIVYEKDTEERTHEDCFIDQIYAESSNEEEKCSSSKNNDNDIPSNNSDGALLETNVTNISIPDPNLEIVHWMDGNYQIVYEEDTEERTHEDCFIDQVYADSSNDEEKCSTSKNNDNDIPSNNSDGALLETNVTNISIPDPNSEIVHWTDGNYQIIYEADTEEPTHEDCFIDQVYAESSNDEEKCSSSKNNDNDIPSNNSDGALLETNVTNISIPDLNSEIVHWTDGNYQIIYEEDTEEPTHEDCFIDQVYAESSNDEEKCSSSKNYDNDIQSNNSDGALLETNVTNISIPDPNSEIVHWTDGNYQIIYEEDTEEPTHEDCFIDQVYAESSNDEEKCSSSKNYDNDIQSNNSDGALLETNVTNISIPDPNSEIVHWMDGNYQIVYEEDTEERTHEDCFIDQVYADSSNDEEKCSTSKNYDNDIPSNNSDGALLETNVTNISIPDPNLEIVHWMDGNYQIVYEEDTEERTHEDCFIDQVYADSSNDEEKCSTSKNNDNDIPSNNSDGALLETNVTNISIPNLEIVHCMDGNYQMVYEEDTEEPTHEDCPVEQVYSNRTNDEEDVEVPIPDSDSEISIPDSESDISITDSRN